MLLLAAVDATAAEKKPIGDIDTNALTNETQAMPADEPDKHMSLAWWMPSEFWQASFANHRIRDAEVDGPVRLPLSRGRLDDPADLVSSGTPRVVVEIRLRSPPA